MAPPCPPAEPPARPAVPPLVDPPVLFAERGASRHVEPDSLEAHRLALRLGATGVLTSVRAGDGGLVLGPGPRRLRRRSAVAGVGLDELYGVVAGTGTQLAVLVPDAVVGRAVATEARRLGEIERLWICSPSLDALVELRAETLAARLLHRCSPAAADGGAERHAARLRSDAVDGVLVAEAQVSAGLVALLHRFGRLVVAEGSNHPRTASRGLSHGVDGIAGTDVEALVDAMAAGSD